MSLFKIINSRKIKKTDGVASEFEVKILKGNLSLQEEFTLFETHHKITFKILKIIGLTSDHFRIQTSRPIMFDGQWKNTEVNTKDLEQNRKYGYKS